MATKTITAMFKTREEAERAGQMLMSQLGIDRSMVRTSPGTGVTDTGYDAAHPYEEKGFFASLKDLFVPDEDRYAYAEGMRRGAVLLSATVDEGHVDQAADVLEHSGAVDLDAQEAMWRKSGWTGYDATAHGAVMPVAATGTTMPATATGTAAMPATAMQAGSGDTIKVVQERLIVGKRDVDRGRVKVRSYVVERPVEEQVVLHQESVHVERHPVDRVATAADTAAFQERTIEARATSEEAVVGKDVRVVEEIGIHKDVSERAETVRDTVRETKVDIEDTTGTANTVGSATTTGTARIPDGTPGNPPGNVASRAVDKTLGTNISGTNPDRKA